jgi:hypothetical protein
MKKFHGSGIATGIVARIVSPSSSTKALEHLMLALLIFLKLSSFALADVWTPTEKWDLAWETRYAEWVASPNVHQTMFSCRGRKNCVPGPYEGVAADCADVAYTMRLIFSYENSLPFSAKNPVASAESKVQRFTQAMTRFDAIPAGPKRVVAFANYLGKSLGTETLSLNDSFPLALDQISTGDFFMYKKKAGENFIRHTYNIKNIDVKGNFNLIYATQASKAAGDPLYERVKQLYSPPVKYRWGFRRYLLPDDEIEGTDKVSFLTSYSEAQFDLAKTLSEDAFFAHVKKLLATETESLDAVLVGKLKELCEQIKERVDIVNKGLAHREATALQCMDYTNFDTHSTPSRDGRLKAMVSSLEATWRDGQADTTLLPTTLALTSALLDETTTASGESELLAYCPISYKPGSVVSLREIVRRVKANLLSSHPNDALEARWGETTTDRTKCPAFY